MQPQEKLTTEEIKRKIDRLCRKPITDGVCAGGGMTSVGKMYIKKRGNISKKEMSEIFEHQMTCFKMIEEAKDEILSLLKQL